MPPIRVQTASGVCHITLADLERENALNPESMTALRRAIERADADPTCRAIVLRAEGPHFCKGLDLSAAFLEPGADRVTFQAQFADCLGAIRAAGTPVVAAVASRATGGGMGVVAACDIVIAGPEARFSLPEVIIGMLPQLVAPYLMRRMSPGRVTALAVSSREFGAQEALLFGLVDEVAPDLERALRLQLKRLLRSSPQALAACKQNFDELAALPADRRDALAGQQLARWLSEPSRIDAMRDFAEGLAPPWFQKYRPPRDG